MAATATSRFPYADASPAELRDAILPEDQDSFDDGYQRALDAAAQTLHLDELEAFLSHWRRIAWSVAWKGAEAWRALLAKADRILTTGQLPVGTVSVNEIREKLRVRQAQRPSTRPTQTARYGSSCSAPKAGGS